MATEDLIIGAKVGSDGTWNITKSLGICDLPIYYVKLANWTHTAYRSSMRNILRNERLMLRISGIGQLCNLSGFVCLDINIHKFGDPPLLYLVGMVKYCHKCGRELTDDMIFCPSCGTRAADQAPVWFVHYELDEKDYAIAVDGSSGKNLGRGKTLIQSDVNRTS